MLGVFLCTSTVATAHQPRIVENTQITVKDFEISKSYYGQLEGEPHVYTIEASEEFNLYVNVLVPDSQGQKKDVSAEIFKGGQSIKKRLFLMNHQ